MMRVGVIGLGWMGKLHLRVYSEMPKVEVVGVVDVDTEALKEVADLYGVPVFTRLHDLLDQELDAVSVCVPTSLHHEVGLDVMKRGLPLLIEKPLAATVAEGEDLVAEARRRGLQLMVGHIERFNPAVGRVKNLVQEDEVISIQIERVGPYPPRIQDVGVIKDLGSHDIDLIRHLAGSEYKRVFAVTSRTIGVHEDTAIITTEMDNGVLGQITTNWVTPYKSRHIRVAMKNGYIEADLITQQVKQYSKFTTYDASYSVREWPLVYKEPVKVELLQFLEAVRDKTPMPISGEDGLAVLRTIEELLDEAGKGRGTIGR
jgi:predicted dehydrogenase